MKSAVIEGQKTWRLVRYQCQDCPWNKSAAMAGDEKTKKFKDLGNRARFHVDSTGHLVTCDRHQTSEMWKVERKK